MSENPYRAPNEASKVAPVPPKPNYAVLKWLVGAAIVLVVIGLLLPSVRTARPAVRRMACGNNLKQISLALLQYERQHGALPPAFTISPDGERLHSWRALILPLLMEQDVYDSIDFEKPWDDPVNAHAFGSCPTVFQCTSNALPLSYTGYLAMVGSERCFHPTESRTLSDITDGLSNTLMIVEVAPDKAVHWMCPSDVEEPLSAVLDVKTQSPHEGGRNSAFADGHVFFLSNKMDHATLRSLETIAAGDGISTD